jgi:uncharacterized protein (TIGR03435 family)
VTRTLAVALLTAALPAAFAQQKPAEKLGFEVASIKPSDPNPSNPVFIGMSADGAMVKYTNITLRDCIRGAYRARDFQIVGPDWMTRARFEISAKLPAGASMDQIPEMLQSLLEERFKMEILREQKETNVYALLVGNGGAKLKPAEVKTDAGAPTALGPDGKPRAMMQFGYPPGGVFVKAQSATLESIVGLMSRFTARPVIDLTGIQGQYEFDLSFSPDGNVELPGVMAVGPDGKPMQPEPLPSLFDAVRKYGLRLEARKAPIEMLIVTHLEKTPTEN